MDIETREQGIRAKADLITAVILVVVGLAIFYFSYTMPRLEQRNIHPTTIPGLVPMILGAALAVLGTMLGVNAWRTRQGGWDDFLAIFGSMAAARVAAGGALVLIYTLGLIGAMPFWAASMIFVFTFIIAMELVLTSEPSPLKRSLFWAIVTATGSSAAIYYLFAQIFLVRLP